MKRKKEIKRFKERKKKKGICEIINVYIVERKKKGCYRVLSEDQVIQGPFRNCKGIGTVDVAQMYH